MVCTLAVLVFLAAPVYSVSKPIPPSRISQFKDFLNNSVLVSPTTEFHRSDLDEFVQWNFKTHEEGNKMFLLFGANWNSKMSVLQRTKEGGSQGKSLRMSMPQQRQRKVETESTTTYRQFGIDADVHIPEQPDGINEFYFLSLTGNAVRPNEIHLIGLQWKRNYDGKSDVITASITQNQKKPDVGKIIFIGPRLDSSQRFSWRVSKKGLHFSVDNQTVIENLQLTEWHQGGLDTRAGVQLVSTDSDIDPENVRAVSWFQSFKYIEE